MPLLLVDDVIKDKDTSKIAAQWIFLFLLAKYSCFLLI